MNTIQNFLWNRRQKNRRTVHEQLELALPGSRLTRDEVDFLSEIRRLKEQLAAASGRG